MGSVAEECWSIIICSVIRLRLHWNRTVLVQLQQGHGHEAVRKYHLSYPASLC